MSKRLQFPLQKVLDVRRHFENQKALDLNRAQNHLSRVQNQLEQLERSKLQTMQRQYSQNNGDSQFQSLDLVRMRIEHGYLQQVNNQIKRQQGEVDHSRKRVDEKRTDLLKATKEKKMMENLKDHAIEQQKKAIRQEENKRADEIAINRNVRIKRGVL